MREIVTLQCGVCKERNYSTTKNKKTTTGRLEFSKFCNRCRKHTDHKETKYQALRKLATGPAIKSILPAWLNF